MDIREKSYFKRYEFEKGIIIKKMNGLNTNDELKMNISKSIVDLYFKETSSWFYKEEKECWDKLSLTLKELDTKLEDVKLKKIFWFIVFNIFVFWNEDNNFIILQVRKFVDKRDLDRLNLSLKDYSGTIKKLIHKLRTEDSFVVGHYILNILNNKILISKDNNSVEIYKDKKVDSGYFGIVYLRHAFLDKDKYKQISKGKKVDVDILNEDILKLIRCLFLSDFEDDVVLYIKENFLDEVDLSQPMIEALDRYFIHVYKMVRDNTIPLEYFLESYDIYL